MKNNFLRLCAILMFVQIACNQAPKEQNYRYKEQAVSAATVADAETMPPPSPMEAAASKAKTGATYDSVATNLRIAAPSEKKNRKVARTAEMRFKVENVAQTTTKIEDLTKRFGGFIEKTNLSSSQEERQTREISADSLLEVTRYGVQNMLTLRVPDSKLDTLLKSLAPLYLFLDYRKITAEDLTLQFVQNELQTRNAEAAARRIRAAADKANKARLNDIVSAEETAAELKNNNVERLINNRGIDERVQYATVELQLYQPANVQKQVIVNDSLGRFRPSFFQNLGLALASGWEALLSVVLFFANLWAVILIVVTAIWVFRRFVRPYWKRPS
jgi:Domain of unknown function (DUF4349)